MKFNDLLDQRDIMTEALIQQALKLNKDDGERVHKALKAASKAWELEQLPILIGKEAAKSLMQKKYGPGV